MEMLFGPVLALFLVFALFRLMVNVAQLIATACGRDLEDENNRLVRRGRRK